MKLLELWRFSGYSTVIIFADILFLAGFDEVAENADEDVWADKDRVDDAPHADADNAGQNEHNVVGIRQEFCIGFATAGKLGSNASEEVWEW